MSLRDVKPFLNWPSFEKMYNNVKHAKKYFFFPSEELYIHSTTWPDTWNLVGLLLFCRFSSNLDFLDHCIFCKTLSWKNLLVKLNSATFDVPWSSQGHFTHGQDTRDPLAETLTLILSPPFSISKKIHFVPLEWLLLLQKYFAKVMLPHLRANMICKAEVKSDFKQLENSWKSTRKIYFEPQSAIWTRFERSLVMALTTGWFTMNRQSSDNFLSSSYNDNLLKASCT